MFRKDKAKDLMAYLKEGLSESSEGPAFASVKPKSEEEHGIEIVEAVGGLAPEFEEAAVMFSNGQIGDTATLLNRYLLEHPDSMDPLPWHMLFDLYESTGQRPQFEDAAVEYAIKFERSPPTWAAPEAAPKVAQSAPLLVYGETYGSSERVKLPKFLQDAQSAPYVRMDITKVHATEEATAQSVLADIQRVNALGKPLELHGTAGFVVRMEASRKEPGRLPQVGWMLLLEVLRLLGKEAEFDAVALDYAVAFEVSPPAYVKPLPLPGKPSGEATGGAATENFALRGVIAPGAEAQLYEMKAYIAGRAQSTIDLSSLLRLDFACVGQLLALLGDLNPKPGQVVLHHPNALVETLMRIVGIQQYAAIKSKPRA